MWRALYAAIFGAPTSSTPVAARAPKPRLPAADSKFAADFNAFQAAVKAVPLELPAKSRGPWVPGPPKHAVKLSALPIGDASHHDLGSGAGFSLGVVGESHRQAALHALDNGRLQRGEQVTFTAALTLEPTNPVDANAIMVSIRDGAHVGYLQRDDAVRYRPVFTALAARHLIGVARAKLIGGVVGKPSIGVMLDINQPTDLLESLAPEGQPF
jgi:hypothetical protein